jgi:hypothetical protein
MAALIRNNQALILTILGLQELETNDLHWNRRVFTLRDILYVIMQLKYIIISERFIITAKIRVYTANWASNLRIFMLFLTYLCSF